MKINKLEVRNFRSIEKALFELAHINVIFAGNNNGKTSSALALEVGLTGKCKFSSRSSKNLIRHGANQTVIRAHVDGYGAVTRKIARSGGSKVYSGKNRIASKELEQDFLEKFGVDYDIISMVMDASELSEMNSTEKKDFFFTKVFQSTFNNLNVDTIIEYMKNPNEAAEAIVRKHLPDKITVDDLDGLYKTFKEKRKIYKKKRDEFVFQLKGIELKEIDIDVKEVEEEVSELNKARDQLLKDISAIEQQNRQKEQISQEIAKIDAKVKVLEGKIKTSKTIAELISLKEEYAKQAEELLQKASTLKQQQKQKQSILKDMKATNLVQQLERLQGQVASKKTIEELKAQIERLENDIPVLEEKKNGFSGQYISIQEHNKSLGKMIKSLDGEKCPLAPKKLVCKTTERAGLRDEFEGEYKANEKKMAEIAKEGKLIAKQIAMCKDEVKKATLQIDLKKEVASLQKQKATFDKMLKDYEGIDFEKELSSLKERYEKAIRYRRGLEQEAEFKRSLVELQDQKKSLFEMLKSVKSKDSSKYKEEIQQVDKKLKVRVEMVEKFKQYQQAKKQKEELAKKVEKARKGVAAMEYLVEEFSPRGLKQRILKKIIAPIENHCNQSLKTLADDYRLFFDFSDEFDILIETKSGIVPLAELSDSEMLRMNLILQDAINSLTNAKLLIVDNLEILDAKNRKLFISYIKSIKERYDTIILLQTGGNTSDFSELGDVKLFRLDSGKIANVA